MDLVSLKCDLDYAKISELVSASIAALEDLADEVQGKLIADEVIPYRTGFLQNSMSQSQAAKGSVNIVYSADYADSLYYSNCTFNQAINSRAQSHWMDYLFELNILEEMYAKHFKERSKV